MHGGKMWYERAQRVITVSQDENKTVGGNIKTFRLQHRDHKTLT